MEPLFYPPVPLRSVLQGKVPGGLHVLSDGEISPQVCIGLGFPDRRKHSLMFTVRHFVPAAQDGKR